MNSSKLLYVFWFYLGLLVAGFVFMSYADAGTFAGLGVGVGPSADGNLGETQFINGGYRFDTGTIFTAQLDGGAWNDGAGNGRKSSFYLASMAGLEVKPPDSVFRLMTGVAGVTAPDTYLGGPLAFSHEAFVGIRDGGVSVGFTYRHISNFGLYRQNAGRDFIGVRMEIPL